MINQHETQGSNPPKGKLILPAYPQQALPVYPDPEQRAASGNTGNLQNTQIHPDQLIRYSATPLPKQPLAKLRYFWQKDPAYKVLVIAVAVILFAGVVFASLIGNALLRNPHFYAVDNTLSQNAPTAILPTGTVDLRPTFPPPGGGNGSTSSSQPPTQGTPYLPSTPNASPTSNPVGGGNLTISITGIPNHVVNNTVVDVSVNTSLPNATVTLFVSYNGPPFRYVSASTTTDGNGDAVLSWSVAVIMYGRQTRATVIAIARDQNGQRAQSQPVSVQIAPAG
jgi:hypothetical protein